MSYFLVAIKQSHEGCDYGIGCGMRYETIEADSIEMVEEQIIWPEGRDEYPYIKQHQIDEIIIVPLDNAHYVDIDGVLNQMNAEEALIKKQIKEKEELAELARLQKKYQK